MKNKRKRKSGGALKLTDRGKKKRHPPIQPPIAPPPPEVPPLAAEVVAISNVDKVTLFDEDDDEFMEASESTERSGEDTSEFLDALDAVDDVSVIGELSQMEERLLISLYYRRIGSPPPDKWDGVGGTVSTIASAINFTHKQRRRIKEVITSTYESLTSGLQYDPSRAPRDPNISAVIKEGSKVQSLVADVIESGLSFSLATSFINQILISTGEVFTVTRSAVYSCALRMKGRQSSITKRPQGSTDQNSTWAICRYRFVTQLLIRFGYDVEITAFLNEDGTIPDCFNKEKLTNFPALNVCGIAFWDEVHKKCHISNFGEGKKTQTQFPRDENGIYDPNGEYREEGLVHLNVKFPKEARLCLGVAMKVGDDGEQHGHRLTPFDYTQKTIITKKESDERIEKAIAQVKRLKRTTKAWLKTSRPEGAIYLDDPVKVINGIGPKTAMILASGNVHTVGDLLALGPAMECGFTQHANKDMYIPALKSKFDQCRPHIVHSAAPEIQSYLDADNPYQAKFGDKLDDWGEEVWMTIIKNSTAFAGVACITELVKHIVVHTRDLYKDSPFSNTYYFYHDALTQLTHESCVEWMKVTKIPGEDTCIYSRWVKPELGLNDQFGKRWWQRPIGNSPEMMPLDNSLNQDVHEAVRHQVSFSLVLRQFVTEEDPRLFSMATPKATAEAYKRTNHPITGISPTPKRIEQDVRKFPDALWAIYHAKGVYVPGLASSTPGHRHIVTAEKSCNRGGKRKRLEHNPILCGAKTHQDLHAIIAERGSDIFAMNSLFERWSNADDKTNTGEADVNEDELLDEQDVGQYY